MFNDDKNILEISKLSESEFKMFVASELRAINTRFGTIETNFKHDTVVINKVSDSMQKIYGVFFGIGEHGGFVRRCDENHKGLNFRLEKLEKTLKEFESKLNDQSTKIHKDYDFEIKELNEKVDKIEIARAYNKGKMVGIMAMISFVSAVLALFLKHVFQGVFK